MEKETKSGLIKIGVSAVLLAAAFAADRILALPMWGRLLVYLVPYLTVAYDVLWEAGENILHGRVFDENFLMSLATLGALCIGFLPNAEPQFAEAVFVMLFFKVGEVFEETAQENSKRSIAHLMDIRPESAAVERGTVTVTVAPEDVKTGEVIVIKPGEKIPLDGVIEEGASAVSTIALTGESLPRDVEPGDRVMSGCVNLSGVLRVKVTQTYEHSTVARVLELVENAAQNRSVSETFISRFAGYYTPAVVAGAVLLAFLPPLLSGAFAASFSLWLYRALTFLVVSCPCALVISVPLTFFCGIGGASSHGILIKGSNCMDVLSRAGTVVFDKTGTLTKGVFSVSAVCARNIDDRELLHLAAHVERYSNHPISRSLRDAYPEEDDGCTVTDVRETAGYGIRATVNGDTVCVGNLKMMHTLSIDPEPCEHTGTVVYVAINGDYAGHIVISDKIKPDAAQAVSELKAKGVNKCVMLSGDSEQTCREVAQLAGIDEYHAGLLPEDKVNITKHLRDENSKGKALVFVGDGINDAPVLAGADLGIAMGALGSDAAIEAADIVLTDDKPSKIAKAMSICKKTKGIAHQNIVFALAVKLAVLALAMLGYAPMLLAVFADVGVTVLAVINAARALK